MEIQVRILSAGLRETKEEEKIESKNKEEREPDFEIGDLACNMRELLEICKRRKLLKGITVGGKDALDVLGTAYNTIFLLEIMIEDSGKGKEKSKETLLREKNQKLIENQNSYTCNAITKETRELITGKLLYKEDGSPVVLEDITTEIPTPVLPESICRASYAVDGDEACIIYEHDILRNDDGEEFTVEFENDEFFIQAADGKRKKLKMATEMGIVGNTVTGKFEFTT